MTEECRHARIRTWVGQDDGKPAGLWACAECGHKFVPLDIAQETDADRYRWLREHTAVTGLSRWTRACSTQFLDEAVDKVIGAP
jgi:hypothetical protein